MKIKSLVSVVLAVLALTWALAVPAMAAVKLPVQTAANKAFIFAKHTCAHDQNCVRYGVTNCNRQSLHVVLCRIFATNAARKRRAATTAPAWSASPSIRSATG